MTGYVQPSCASGSADIPRSGIIIPNMGSANRPRVRASHSLADALFAGTRKKVLALLFAEPGRTFYVTELIQRAHAGSGAVQRELERLAQSGIILRRSIGNQTHYQANRESPIFQELAGIIEKTAGVAEPIRNALRPFESRIVAAFVYGSLAKGSDTARSDIDLMVISDAVGYGDVFGALEPVSARLKRTVNPTVFTRGDFARRIKTGNAFVKRVLSRPKIWIFGSENDVEA